MKTKIIFAVMMITLICVSCKQTPIAEKIATLKCGESTKIESTLCDQMINATDGDIIKIGTKKYVLCKEPVIAAIKGCINYTLVANNEKLEVTITVGEGLPITSGTMKKVCDGFPQKFIEKATRHLLVVFSCFLCHLRYTY